MRINEYFDKVIVINLARRRDRWTQVLDECRKHNLSVDRFEGCDFGVHDGNRGCTESHGAVLRMIVENGWPRTLVLEDDFMFRFDDSQEQFSAMIPNVPENWFMLYLGGHYAEKPCRRISKNVIQMGRMKTTSSYGVTLEAAKEMAPFIHGIGPIDELYGAWHDTKPCFIFSPRLIVQRPGFSDLQQREMENITCMEDSYHESMI